MTELSSQGTEVNTYSLSFKALCPLKKKKKKKEKEKKTKEKSDPPL